MSTTKERPILFSAPMVRAILDGRKTQTRRTIKEQPKNGWKYVCPGLGDLKPVLGEITSPHPKKGKFGVFSVKSEDGFTVRDLTVCPYGRPGDRLWVREAFRLFDAQEECACYDLCVCSRHHGKPVYRADEDCGESKWKPSIHMPRWASRILLEIVSVRVERLNDISEADAEAEGCDNRNSDAAQSQGWYERPIRALRRVWENINGAGSWDANPWVWVVEFKRIEQGDNK